MTQEDNEETDQKITLATAIYQQLRDDIITRSARGPVPIPTF
jgi:hypothetical protein